MAIGQMCGQCEQLQTHRWVTTTRDVTLHGVRPNVPGQRAPFLVRSCSAMKQTEEVANSSACTEDETHCLISLWGEWLLSSQAPGHVLQQIHLALVAIV